MTLIENSTEFSKIRWFK